MHRLEGKVIIVTGAKGGLGSSVTQALLAESARVVGVSRSISAADLEHPLFTAKAAELNSSAAADNLIASIAAEFGRVDALVHLLGGFAGGTPVAETSNETFESMIDLNLRSAFYTFRAVLPQMRAQRSGRLIAIGSKAAVDNNAGAGVYSASKAALIALVRAIAAENRDVCISANVILPGTMDTPANRKAMPSADPSHWVQPSQVANLIVAMASDEVPQMSGAVLPIYGADL